MLIHCLISLVFSLNPYQPPQPTDQRSPCPGLNILANHGYINRNGTEIRFSDLSLALSNIFGWDDELISNSLIYLSAGTPGRNANGNLDLAALSFHNYLEHDASLVHDDFYFGDNSKMNPAKLLKLISLGSDGFITMSNLAQHKSDMINFSQKNNLIYDMPDYPIPVESLFQWIKGAMLLQVAGDGNRASSENIRTILGDEALPSDYILPAPSSFTFVNAQAMAMKFKEMTMKLPGIPLSLPNQLSQDELLLRNDGLNFFQKQIEMVPIFIKIKNMPNQQWGYGRGPKPNDWFFNISKKGMHNVSIRSAIARAMPIAALSSVLKGPNPIPLNTLEDIANIHNAISNIVPVPKTLYRWNLDESFGEDRLTYGGYSLKIETSNVLNIETSLATSITGSSIDELLKSKRLFKVDYSALGKYSKSNMGQDNPFNQFVPSVYAQFYVASNGKLMPLAIKIIETGLIYTPKDSENDWMFAKLAFGCAEGVFFSTEHFVVNHMIFQGIQAELLRTVSVDHPVATLLNHHLRDNFGNVAMGVELLLDSDTTFDKIFGCGCVGATKLIEDRFKIYNFEEEQIRNLLKFELKGFKYKDDIVSIHSAMNRFVYGFLKNIYKDDATFQEDYEIKNWAAAVASPSGGGIKGFPATFTTLESLAEVITDIIIIATAQHNVLNGSGTKEGQSLPVLSHAFYKELPKAKGQVTNTREFLAPNAELIFSELEIIFGFAIPISKNSNFGFSYGNELGPIAELIEPLQKELKQISANIYQREKNNPRPFDVLDPMTLPYHVWI